MYEFPFSAWSSGYRGNSPGPEGVIERIPVFAGEDVEFLVGWVNQ